MITMIHRIGSIGTCSIMIESHIVITPPLLLCFLKHEHTIIIHANPNIYIYTTLSSIDLRETGEVRYDCKPVKDEYLPEGYVCS